jgi:hypothetical protein
MPLSRQERRKAERDTAKKATGAAGAAAALANLNVNTNPLGDWSMQEESPQVLISALGPRADILLKQQAAAGDACAQYSLAGGVGL